MFVCRYLTLLYVYYTYIRVFIMRVLYLYLYTHIGSGDPLRTIGRETPSSPTFIIPCPIDRVASSSLRASVYTII